MKNLRGMISNPQKPNSSDFFPHLPSLGKNRIKKQLQVGIVTPEIIGPPHAGIGTAYNELAESLADDGNLVTLLFVPYENPPANLFQIWKMNYEKKKIRLEIPPPDARESVHSLWTNAKWSYVVMRWLLGMPSFDILHFPDWKGLGYYTALAKSQGLSFSETAIVIGTHGSTFWDATYSYGDKSYYQDFMERNFLERESIRLSDYVISPSQYYIRWLKNELNWQFPDQSYVQPNLIKSNLPPKKKHVDEEAVSIHEIVFFGRLEKRKGLVLFCDALDHPDICIRKDFSVSFMGHSTYIDGMKAYDYIKERSSKWQFSWKIIPRKNRDEALSYLSEPGRLALIPSLSETMSYTVLECLLERIPFLAARSGGIPELIDSSDLERVTFELLPHKLALALERVIGHDFRPSTPAFDINENEKRWVEWHQYIATAPEKPTITKKADPLVSVCLVVDENIPFPEKLELSLCSQSYSRIEVIVIQSGCAEEDRDRDRSRFPGEFQKHGWCILKLKDRDISAARNFAAENASGEYLLFLDSEIELDCEAISCLASVAEKSDADILTFAQNIFSNTETNPFKETVRFHLGNCLSLGALHNVFGDSNMLVKGSVFKDLSGFSENNYFGDSVWEFFAKASVSGYKLEAIPFPLVRKHRLPQRENKFPRFVHPHPYLSNVPEQFKDIFNFVQASRFFHDPSPDGSFIEGFVNRPQVFIDNYWESKPWKFFLPLANKTRKFFNLPVYQYPHITTLTEAIRAIQTIHQSFFWSLVVQLKNVKRIFNVRNRARHK